jgi:hypothetical protein
MPYQALETEDRASVPPSHHPWSRCHRIRQERQERSNGSGSPGMGFSGALESVAISAQIELVFGVLSHGLRMKTEMVGTKRQALDVEPVAELGGNHGGWGANAKARIDAPITSDNICHIKSVVYTLRVNMSYFLRLLRLNLLCYPLDNTPCRLVYSLPGRGIESPPVHPFVATAADEHSCRRVTLERTPA